MNLNFLADIVAVVTLLTPFVIPLALKLNEMENKARDLLHTVDSDLLRMADYQKNQQQIKVTLALLEHRMSNVEKYLEKSGFHPSDLDKKSFL